MGIGSLLLEYPTPNALQTDSGGNAATSALPYALLVPPTAAGSLKVTANDNSYFTWQPTEMVYTDDSGQLDYIVGSSPSSLTTTGTQARYSRTFPSADDVFNAEAERVKHWVVVNTPPRAPASYLAQNVMLGVSGIIGGVTIAPGFYDEINVGLFTLPQPVATDLTGKTVTGKYQVLNGTNGQQLFAWIPYEFAVNAVYPLIIDPTVTTTTSSSALANSNQRHLDRDASNNLWLMQIVSSTAKFYTSTDGGTTWTYASTSDIANVGNASIFIDKDGYMHVAYVDTSNSNAITYRRGTLSSGNWTWSAATVAIGNVWYQSAVSSGYWGIDSPDIVAHEQGTGWIAHITAAEFGGSDPNGTGTATYTWKLKYNNVAISSTGTLTGATVVTITNPGGGSYTSSGGANGLRRASIAFSHTGDGKTVKNGTPNLFVLWDNQYATSPSMEAWMGTYASGPSWTWSKVATAGTSNSYLNAAFDGMRFVCARVNNAGTPFVDVFEYDTSTSKSNNLGNTNTGDGNGLGVQVTCTQFGDIYVFVTMATSKLTKVLHYTRKTATWSSWTSLSSNVTPATASDVAAKRVDSNYQVEAINIEGSANPYNLVYYMYATTDLAPNAPVLNSVTPFDATIAQTLTWQFSDPNIGDSQSAYQLQIVDSSTSTTVVDTGKVASTSTSYSLAANTLTNGHSYQWRVTTWDSDNQQGPYSSYSTFDCAAPPTVSIVSPTNNETVTVSSITAEWSYSDPASNAQQDFRVVLLAADDQTIVYDSGTVASSNKQFTIPITLNNHTTYHVQVTVTNSKGIVSTAIDNAFTTSFSVAYSPDNLSSTASQTEGYTSLSWTNPAYKTSATIPSFTGTGNGTMSEPTTTDGTTNNGTWVVTCTNATAPATFSVTVNGTNVGIATAGTAFSHNGVTFTITAGSTAFAVNDQFTFYTNAFTVAYNRLYKQVNAAWSLLADKLTTGQISDYAVANGQAVTYGISAMGDNGIETPVIAFSSVTPAFTGDWIYDPTTGNQFQFLYNRAKYSLKTQQERKEFQTFGTKPMVRRGPLNARQGTLAALFINGSVSPITQLQNFEASYNAHPTFVLKTAAGEVFNVDLHDYSRDMPMEFLNTQAIGISVQWTEVS